MADQASLVIRGGTIIDGSGGEAQEADLAISGGQIQAIGKDLPKGAEEIDAKGKIVTPGFIDTHTHYDAQVTWSSSITPSSWNGVTTAMMGNCGVGFAPCKPHQRDLLVELMEGVEDIPEVVLTEGLPWNWQSFEEYLDALDARQYDMDIATQVPHSAVRVFVMGERGANREPATAEDRAAMASLAAAGVKAGALGFSTSRTINHKTLDGKLIPTLNSDEAELGDIAAALGKIGAGWMQVISDFDDVDPEFDMLQRVTKRSGRPMAITILQRDSKPDEWRHVMSRISDARAAGTSMLGQVLSRATGVLLGFEISQNPFFGRPIWDEIATLTLEEKLKVLHQPDFRARLLSETCDDPVLAYRLNRWDRIFPLGDPPDYEPPYEASIAAIAERQGRDPQDVAYDLCLQKEGRAILYRPLSNYTSGDLSAVQDMIQHPDTIVSLGDGGAHVGILCDASAMTYMLTHWTRDRTRGDTVPLPWAIRRLTRDSAAAIGLNDRGLLRAGMKADINVIDYDQLQLGAPKVVYDLPSGGRRVIQKAHGFDATIVSGTPVFRHGEATGNLPGRLVRGAR